MLLTIAVTPPGPVFIKDVEIRPEFHELTFKINEDSKAKVKLLDDYSLSLSTDGGAIRLSPVNNHVIIGDGITGSDIVFEKDAKIRALAGATLTLGQSDSNVDVASKGIRIAAGGTLFGEYHGSESTSYTNGIVSLTGGTNFGTLIRTRLGGHLVFALHGEDNTDSVVFASYTTNTSPSHLIPPNRMLLSLSRLGTLKLGPVYQVNGGGLLAIDGNGVVSVAPAISVAAGGTGTGNAPTANKFLAYNGSIITSTAYDETSFARADEDVTVTGSWIYTLPIDASILGNADTATFATSATTATTAGRWTSARTITLAGEVVGSVSIDGSANVTINTTLEDGIVTPGSYTYVTVDSKGRVIAGGTAGVGDAATLGGLTNSTFLRVDIDTVKSSGYFTVAPAGTKSFFRAWEATGKTAFGISVKDDSVWLSAGTWFDGTNWKQQNSGSTGNAVVLRLIPGVGLRYYSASQTGEGNNVAAWNQCNGHIIIDAQGRIPTSVLVGPLDAINLTGGTYGISITGNALTATSATTANSAATAIKLTTGRNITITGDVSGVTNTAFDGTANVSMNVLIGQSKVAVFHLQTKYRGPSINTDPYCEDSTAWRTLEGASNYTFVTINDGAVSNTAIRGVAGLNARFGTQIIPIDRSKVYRFAARIRSQSSSDNEVYTGVQFYNVSGSIIQNTGVDYFYAGANNVIPPVSWTLYEWTVGPSGSGADIIYPAGAIKMAHIVILQTTGTTGFNEVQDIRIDERIEGVLIRNGAITNEKLADGAVNNSKLAAGNYSNITGVGTLSSLTVTGTINAASIVGTFSGDAQNATKLLNARQFSISGDIQASAIAFDGTANVTFNSTIVNIPAVSGALLTNLNASALSSGTVANARIAGNYTGFTGITTSGQLVSTVTQGTAPFVIASTTLVSGLNAQYLNGKTDSQFAPAAHVHTITQVTGLVNPVGNETRYLRVKADGSGYEAVAASTIASDIGSGSNADPTFTGSLTITSLLKIDDWTNISADGIDALLPGTASGTYLEGPVGKSLVIGIQSDDTTDGFYIVTKGTSPSGTKASDPYSVLALAVSPTVFTYYGGTIWHSNNDGASSGLDSDLLDGQHGAFYLDPANLSAIIPSNKLSGTYGISISGNAATATDAVTATKLLTARNFTFNGDVSGGPSSFDGTANVSVGLTLASIATAGTYRSVTIDAKGRVTTGTNPTTLAGYGITDAVGQIVFTRTVPVTVNDIVELGNYTVTNGTQSFMMSVVLDDATVSISKTYIVNVKYNHTANVWQILTPLTSTGVFSGTDFAVDLNVSLNVIYLRLRKVSGSATGSATVTIIPMQRSGSTWAGTSATGSVSAPSTTFTPFTIGSGGAGTDADTLDGLNSTYFLDFNNLTNKPTTVAGYGITNAVTTGGNNTVTGNFQIGVSATDNKVLNVIRGSASAPTITAIGTATSGIYFPNSGVNIGFAVSGVAHLELLGSSITRFGDPTTTQSRNLFLQANHATAEPFGAAIGIGGYYGAGVTTVTTTDATANANGSVHIVMHSILARPKFQLTALQPTAAGGVQTANPGTLFEVWGPSVAGINAVNYVKISATETSVSPLIEVAGADTNINLRLSAKGTGVINAISDVQTSNKVAIGRTILSTAQLAIDGNGLATALSINSKTLTLGVGQTSALKQGLAIDVSISDAAMQGTITSLEGVTITHGYASASGAITATHGLRINSLTSTGTIGTAWALNQTDNGTLAKNYLQSPLLIASTSGWTDEKLLVTGKAKITSDVAIGGNLTLTGTLALSALSNSGAYIEGLNADLYSYRNVGYLASNASSTTGILKIALPVGWSGSNIRVKLLISNLGTSSSAELVVAGQNAGSSWTSVTAFADGSFPSDRVRLAYDGTKCVILLGSTSTIWSYPKVIVKEVVVSQASMTSFATGWALSIISSETGITSAVEPTINATFVGLGGSSDVNATSNTVVKRDSNADVFARYFRSEQNADESGFGHIVVQIARGSGNDNYLRTASKATFKTAMNLVIGTDIQAADATLTSLAGLTGAGVIVATATDTFVMRSIGVGSATDILDRQSGDGRYLLLSGNQAVTGDITYDGTLIIKDGNFSGANDALVKAYVVKGITTNTTPLVLTMPSSAKMVLANDSTWTFMAYVSARRADADSDSAGWVIKGVITRNSSASTTAIVGDTTIETLTKTDGSLDVVAVANTTDGSLDIQVTGAASKTIRWLASVQTVEIVG